MPTTVAISKYRNGYLLCLESHLDIGLDVTFGKGTFWLHKMTIEDIKNLADGLAQAYQEIAGKER